MAIKQTNVSKFRKGVCVSSLSRLSDSPLGISLFPPLLSPGGGLVCGGPVMMPTLEEVGCFWNHLLLWEVRHTYLPVKPGGPGSGWSVQELSCALLPTQPLGLKALGAVSHGALHESVLNPGTDHDPGRQQVVTAFPGIRKQGL